MASNAADVSQAYTFTNTQLGQNAAFAALFDQVRIDAIRFSIIPTSNAVQVPTQASTAFVQLYCILDYDGIATPNTAALMRERDNCLILEPGESCERTFKPLSQGGSSSNPLLQMDPWYPISKNPVYNGLVVFIPQVTAAQTVLQSWNLEVEFFLSFRSLV